MIIKRYTYRLNIVLVGLLLLIVAGCREDESSLPAGMGRLVISGMNVDAAVSQAPTRASFDYSSVSQSDFTITLTNKDDAEDVVVFDPATAEIAVKAGSYTLAASYGKNECGTTPFFYGETDVDIVAFQTTTASLTASLKSSVIHPVISTEMAEQFDSYSLSVKCADDSHSSIAIANDEDYFVPSGADYSLTMSGTNKIGEEKRLVVYELKSAVAATVYNINCNPDLPAFNMPAQAETNGWSKFIYITPMTADDITYKKNLADKIISNVVYEASLDNFSTVYTSTKDDDGNIVIKGLEANKTYSIRARFVNTISSNVVTLTTESAQELAYGDMETWSTTTVYSGANDRCVPILCYYLGSTNSGWATRNTLTTNGAENAKTGTSSSASYAVYWRWHSNTRSYSDNGGTVAEISNLAFYNQRVTVAATGVLSKVQGNGTIRSAFLCTGTYDKSSDKITFSGISHNTRPVSISFEYKYIERDSKNGLAYAKMYDSAGNVIATTEDFMIGAGDDSNSYTTAKLKFSYSDMTVKAAKIGIMFKSSYNDDEGCDISKTELLSTIDGSYDVAPYPYRRVAGSQLYIDNVILNYE